MLYNNIIPWRTRRCRTFLYLLAALALVSPEAVAATIEAIDPPTISTSISGALMPTYTWTVVTGTTAIASLRIQGAGTGETIGLDDIHQPTGWTFTGNAQAGTYEWQTSANVTGTFVFSIMFAAPSDSEPAGSVEYDVLTGTTRTFTSFTPPTPPTPKDASNWALTPIPETSGLWLVGFGLVTLAGYRRIRPAI